MGASLRLAGIGGLAAACALVGFASGLAQGDANAPPAAPPASAGAQSFTVTCQNNGTATFTAAAKTKPNTAYASALTYSATNYPTGTIGTTTLQCVPVG